ncbi:Golgi membrane exchange factor (Ric1p-Rgp1p) subunit [Coemansia brasiliensis]|uniref:Golgi membrane exchange factor (Ric1p-Rgp1p) subunit n=1 Tax=Coemansia brasiliensis TaxID=2650707 RepID=A0A9W8I647_9FUNG|nr:Golgi membrane exchange factor (Ric1p-Rgp1p) subunit [Coemansia brasiliensis]
MGLSITATFEKQGIYFAGDTLECHIRFENSQSAAAVPRDIASPALSSSGLLPQLGFGGLSSRRSSIYHAASRHSTSRPFAQRSTTAHNIGDALFPALDASSERSYGSGVAARDEDRRYSTPTGAEDGSHTLIAPPVPTAKYPGVVSTANGFSSTASMTPQQHQQDKASISPALGHSLPENNNSHNGRSDTVRQFPSSSGRKASVFGERILSGTFSERLQNNFSPTEPHRNIPSRKPSNAAPEGSLFPRLSTSSVLSTPTASLASWLPFGSRQPASDDQPVTRPGGPVSDAGSGSSFLGSLWKSLSPSLAHAQTSAEAESSIERLAIGFVEATGSLALSTSYIKPDQLGQLLKHKGTDYTAGPGIRSPPIGGGLGNRVPAASPTVHSASRTQKAIPILISSPAVLFSELELASGESQTFSIKVQLPQALPPSFRGRVSCITYDLVVVAKRNMLESSAFVVRIPFRVMAHVAEEAKPYSFGQPLRMPPDSIQLTFREAAPVSTPRNASPSPLVEDSGLPHLPSDAEMADESSVGASERENSVDELYEQLADSLFLRRCIDDVEQPAKSLESDEGHISSADSQDSTNVEETIKRNLLRVCQRRAPVEFTLSQGGRAVASIWLPRRTYQLGDMLTGRVHLHASRPCIYQVSIWLESVETIQDQFASFDSERNQELTRKIYAEHHQFCRCTNTLGFALASPSAAAPSFASEIMSNVWQLRVELFIGRSFERSFNDLALSATTPFPPLRHQQANSAYSRNALQPQSPPSPPAPLSPPPSDSGLPAANSRPSRARSSTIAESCAQRIAVSADKQLPPRLSIATDDRKASEFLLPRAPSITMRRRYDAVHEVPVQTLSCTVAVQMHPPPSRQLLPGHRDSYVVDLSKRT